MSISTQTQAILLLTAHFAKSSTGDVSPLTPKEWGRFALWLKDSKLKPEDLLSSDMVGMLEGWMDRTVTIERIQQLLARGPALALAMEKWTRAGLWVLTRSDIAYPAKLKQLLKTDSPPLLFGCGNKQLLNQGGLAVVGSRKVSNSDRSYAVGLGKRASKNGVPIISGGARGIDEASMLGALDSGGAAVGVLADSLLRAGSSSKYRKHLLNNQLVLISPFHPEAGFNTGNAMARNKYIYCLSNAAVVVHSGLKGGTWTGAFENLKLAWVPLWVKQTSDKEAGNSQIMAKGGNRLSDNIEEVDFLGLFNAEDKSSDQVLDLFTYSQKQKESVDVSPLESSGLAVNEPDTAIQEPAAGIMIDSSVSFYDLFLAKMAAYKSEEKSINELVSLVEINKTQLSLWLKKAVEDGVVQKLSRPVRYRWTKRD